MKVLFYDADKGKKMNKQQFVDYMGTLRFPGAAGNLVFSPLTKRGDVLKPTQVQPYFSGLAAKKRDGNPPSIPPIAFIDGMKKTALVEMAAQLQAGDGDAVARILRGHNVETLRGLLRPKWQDVMEHFNLTSFCDVDAWDDEYDAPGDDDSDTADDDNDGSGSDGDADGSGEEREEEG